MAFAIADRDQIAIGILVIANLVAVRVGCSGDAPLSIATKRHLRPAIAVDAAVLRLLVRGESLIASAAG